MCANGGMYSSETGLVANLRTQIASLKAEIQKIKSAHGLTLQRMTNLCAEYREQLEEARELIAIMTCSKMPFLDRHLQGLCGNYACENIPTYLEIAQCGEGIWATLVEHMGFPSWRTIQRWRKTMLADQGISRDLLDGSLIHLDKLFRGFFGDDYQEGKHRVVLAVDAAGVTPHVVVHKDGTVDGFLDPNATLPLEDAQRLRESLDDLRGFISENRENIVRDFFVVLACPLESRRGDFQSFSIQKVMDQLILCLWIRWWDCAGM